MNATRIWRNFSIRAKLLTAYLLVALLPMVLLGFSSYSIAKGSAQQEAMAVILQSQQQMIATIEQNCARMESVIELLCANDDILQFTEGRFANPYDEYNIANRMQRTADSMLWGMGGSSGFIVICYAAEAHEIVIQDFDGKLNIRSVSSGQLNPDDTHYMAIYNAKRYAGDDWFSASRDNTLSTKWLQVAQDNALGNISLIKELKIMDIGKRPVGLAKLTVRLKDIFGVMPEDMTTSGYAYFLLDQSGNALTTNENSAIWGAESARFADQIQSLDNNRPAVVGDTALVKSSLRQGWDVLGVYKMHFYKARLAKITGQVILFSLISALLVTLVSIVIARSFARRISRVTLDMEKFRFGQHSVRTKVVGNDEVSQFATGFNDMASKIESLINDVYKAELTIQQEHLSMLQSQINPHFLYNSLSAIIRLSERGKPDLIKKITMALVHFYRLSLSHGNALISFSDEVEHVKSYLDVYQIRRGDDFSVAFDISPETLDCKVPKVILQPFVENAIEHGMPVDHSPKMQIAISADLEDSALICRVTDNGIGMTPEILSRVLKGDDVSTSGYGIKNVNDRIKAYFGRQWGVTLESNPESGTTVTMKMPAR